MTELNEDERAAISVVIPVLNEATVIEGCLGQFDSHPDVQVIVSDGGSEDDTARIAASKTGVEVITLRTPGRSHQMNSGAAAATAPTILFLHADCVLPATWRDDVNAVLDADDTVGGRFRLGISERTLSFRLIAFFSTLRSRCFGITYGDQAIFVRREAFDTVGGFPPRMIFEDSEFCDAIRRLGRFGLTKSSVISSSRRWGACGVWRTVFLMWFLRLLYKCSVGDDRLVRLYRQVR